MGELRAGVMGAGAFGGHHARKYAALPGVTLTAVFDVNAARAETLAGPLGAWGGDDLAGFLGRVDVVTVATPAGSHGDLALAALKAGKPVYVEKPLATTIAEAERLIEEVGRRGLVLAVGHQERAVFGAMGLLAAPERPHLIESVRRGTPSERNRDVSCVLDLMIHDLDLALAVAGGEPVAVEAEGGFDAVRAEVTFDTGLTAAFDASREAPARERTMRAIYSSGEVTVDFLAPSFVNEASFALDPDFALSPAGRDPLGESVTAFIAAVRGGSRRPLADGRDGARALDLALAVELAAGL